ncbi:hypothetical protein [uncultured Christiangramia sp.]|mgnify:CR=1 FL=1|uniref:hypothetical protein n=1 Tax=uncultured Christiangramia sp. TaxID=503836 RepID=UPI0025CD0C96|nr:hypothetical protein [uncultured Christiangramia sp.]
MRSKILMYLFIFALLFCIFIYVNDKRILDSKQEKIEQLEDKLSEVELNQEQQSIATSEDYFNLQDNEDAITYFQNNGVETEGLITKIEDAIISKNSASNDNPLVPHAGMEGSMRINKIKVLNHKWIIADFTDGSYWGEVFLTYTIQEDGAPVFNTEQSFLYPKY